MGTANSNIQLADLDFNNIKQNFIAFLQTQNVLKDYDYSGSALSTLLDVLAYNTQYNAFYLNMVANEMFLDTALQRSSVVSLAKVLNYTPKSVICPSATISMNVYNVTASSLTLPQYTKFLSESIDGVNYTFITNTSTTVNTSANNVAQFNNVTIVQGTPATYSFTVDSVANPTYTFSIPDAQIDTTTLQVTVQQTASNSYYQVYSQAKDYLSLTGTSTVYFLQEGTNGYYEIYFGDGILGQKLSDGNVVNVTYLSSRGTASAGANNFTLMDTISGFGTTVVKSLTAATNGSNKESIGSIQFQAPKSYAAQNRAVTKDDYITLIQQNNVGLSFDAVNVWGGEENSPPQYGKIFVAIKPQGGYSLTDNQKQIITNQIIAPISVLTVVPEIVDVDYVYVILNADVLYNPKKTTLTSTQISSLVTAGIKNYCNNTLNTFNSTFVIGDLIQQTQALDPSIIAIDFDLFLEKRIIPTLNKSLNYTINFGNQLEQGTGDEAFVINPSFATVDALGKTYDPVYFEPSPDTTTNIDSITIVSGGAGYTKPTVTISGDGNGATATATVENGVITGITVTNGGAFYTQAVVVISDPTGAGASAIAVLRGNYGTLRTYYYVNGVKNILNTDAANIDYQNGIATLLNFTPTAINNTDGIVRLIGYSANRIISSTFSQIITLDNNDPSAITVSVTAKS